MRQCRLISLKLFVTIKLRIKLGSVLGGHHLTEVISYNHVINQVMKCNCMMKCYNKSSIQSPDSEFDSQYPTSVDVESAPTHRPQLDSELHLQQSTSVLTRQVSLLHTPNLIFNLIVTGNFSAGRDRAPPLAPSFSKPDSKRVSRRNNSLNDAVPIKAIFPKSRMMSKISAFPAC